jgi:hypothetical protein
MTSRPLSTVASREVPRDSHDDAQKPGGHDQRTEQTDTVMARPVTDDQDERADDDPNDGTDAPASSRHRRHHAYIPAPNIVTIVASLPRNPVNPADRVWQTWPRARA